LTSLLFRNILIVCLTVTLAIIVALAMINNFLMAYVLAKNECINDMIDIMDAFFLVPGKKTRGHPSVAGMFLPLEQ
jgi:hypothetical protein